MIYLTPLCLFTWLMGYANERTGLRNHNYKSYLIIVGSVVALLMGLRTQYTGSTDTYMYRLVYGGIGNYETFREYYDVHLADLEPIFSESGFYLFMWLLRQVFEDPQMLVLTTSVFITFSTCRFIRRNTSDAPFAMLIYVCLGLFTFNMNGMRQAMAMSVCLFAYDFAKRRKLIPFVLTVLLAMQFHKTAICFSMVYFLPLLKTGKANVFFYFCGMAVFLVGMEWFIETFNAFTGEEYLLSDVADGGGIVVIAIYVSAILLTLFMYESLQDRDIRCQFFCVVAGFACYIARFFSNQILERISYYFFYFTILLFPNIINKLDEKERQIIKLGFGFLAVVLLWYRSQTGAFVTFKPFFVR